MALSKNQKTGVIVAPVFLIFSFSFHFVEKNLCRKMIGHEIGT